MDADERNSNEQSSSENQPKENISGFSNMDNFARDGFATIKEAIKSASELPLSDYDFYILKKPFKNIMSAESNRLLNLMNNILRTYGVKGNFKNSSLEFRADLLVEMNDTILEKVDDCIDEINGIKKFSTFPLEGEKSINGSWNRVSNTKFSTNSSSANSTNDPASTLKLLSKREIKRPQESFTDKIDNSNEQPWQPRIKVKPNSLKPLSIFLEETERGEEFSHPYEFELEKFCVPEEQLSLDNEDPTFPKPLEETRLVEVDTEEKLKELVEDLRKYNIIAIDLEHHSYRTFMGITCLMQISTDDTDYIIDTLILRNSLYVLNEIFTKPNILKIFHGADSDILWLQRDLSLYVVNMFDTHQAAKILGYSSLSLAHLLERFCNFSPNKHFQMADWRLRPLPEELKKYARDDTHYLIYIYKLMKKELYHKSGNTSKLLNIVCERSTEICKRRYFKNQCTEYSYLDFYESCKRMFDKRQIYALKELYNWRDYVARTEDESIGYVLPNHMLLQIAETLPKEMQGILACCNPVPPLIRSNLLELHRMILKARDISVDQPILQEDTRARGTLIGKQKFNLDDPFYSPFDLSRNNKNVEDVPVLLDSKEYDTINILKEEETLEKADPIFSVITNESFSIEKPPRNYKSLIPFERYSCVRLFLEDENIKENEQDKLPEDVKPSVPEIIEIEEDVEKIYENLDLLTDDNKTEEEKLASLNNHFSLLSHKTQEDVDTEKRLEERLYQKASSLITERAENIINLGGGQKRPREESEDESDDESDTQQSENTLKSETVKTPNKSPDKQRQHNENPNWKRDNNRKRKSNDGGHPNSPSKKNKFNSPRSKNFQNRREEKTFEPVDYSSVDFRQFQGGAGEVNRGKAFGCKFKTRRSNNKQNKRGRRQ